VFKRINRRKLKAIPRSFSICIALFIMPTSERIEDFYLQKFNQLPEFVDKKMGISMFLA
jgi:hypothetical protein